MQGLVQYLMDTYTIYCASAIASTVIMRSILAALFPLISPFMYGNLGNHWATMVFAFLSLACTPLPFLFFVRQFGAAPCTSADDIHRDTAHGSEASPGSQADVTGGFLQHLLQTPLKRRRKRLARKLFTEAKNAADRHPETLWVSPRCGIQPSFNECVYVQLARRRSSTGPREKTLMA